MGQARHINVLVRVRVLYRPALRSHVGAVQEVEVGSEVIAGIAYDDASRACEVRFANGRVYRYDGVPRSVFDWWMRAPSKGAFFNRKVRDVYPYRELEGDLPPEPDLEALLEASLRSDD